MNRWSTLLPGLALFLALGPAGACAQGDTYELGGYLKYLFTGSTPPAGDARYDHLVHGRLNARWFATEELSAVAEVRARTFYGGSVRATPHFAGTLGQDAGFGTMGVVLWDGASTAGYAEMDRLYLNATTGAWQFTVGRQRIAWGTNLVWNAVDLFNPQSVLDFDHEEKPPVDGVRVQYYTGVVSKIEVAFTPGARRDPTIGAQWTFNTGGYDIHVLAGVRDHGAYGGLAWAGDIAGGGFRGELLVADYDDNYSLHDEVALYGSSSLHPYAGAGTMVAAALSGDYTFPNSFYVHTELLYSSEGVTEKTQLNTIHASHLGLLSPARWSLFQEFSYDISPLVRGGVFAIYNPTDHSSVVFPSLTWSVLTDLDLSLYAMLFSGSPGTEYGAGGTAIIGRLRWSF
jgi:hypothetical protein